MTCCRLWRTSDRAPVCRRFCVLRRRPTTCGPTCAMRCVPAWRCAAGGATCNGVLVAALWGQVSRVRIAAAVEAGQQGFPLIPTNPTHVRPLPPTTFMPQLERDPLAFVQKYLGGEVSVGRSQDRPGSWRLELRSFPATAQAGAARIQPPFKPVCLHWSDGKPCIKGDRCHFCHALPRKFDK